MRFCRVSRVCFQNRKTRTVPKVTQICAMGSSGPSGAPSTPILYTKCVWYFFNDADKIMVPTHSTRFWFFFFCLVLAHTTTKKTRTRSSRTSKPKKKEERRDRHQAVKKELQLYHSSARTRLKSKKRSSLHRYAAKKKNTDRDCF
jgi:hypothetical protein